MEHKTFIRRVYQEPRNMIHNALPRTLPPGYTFDLHCHRNVEVCLITEGACGIAINASSVTVHAGEIIVIFPQVLHSFRVVSDEPVRFYQMHFSVESWREETGCIRSDIKMLDWLFDAHTAYLLLPWSARVRACVENICEDMQQPDDVLSNNLARICVCELLVLLSREVSQSYRHIFELDDPLLIRAVQYINENISRRITASDLAHACCVPQRSLTALFRRVFHMTPNEYINVSKVEKAMHYLTGSAMSISQISESLGFSSTQYFSTVFKNVVRVTPKEYRGMAHRDA